MITDKELLELAAKAVGIKEASYIECVRDHDSKHFGEPAIVAGDSTWRTWNPLVDDGDAFCLAVTLRLCMSWEDDGQVIDVWWPETAENSTQELKGSDPYAATRRTIVRAAAEIGRRKQ